MLDNKPSATALLLASSLVFVSRDPKFGHLVPPLAAEASAWFVEAGSRRGKHLLNAVGKKWFRSFGLGIERLTIPGILLHYVLRKRYLEEIVRNHLLEGFHQIVILGGGFDTLAVRLHQEFPKVQFIEIDHPATQRIKKQVLESRQLCRGNMTLLPINLVREKLEKCLLDCREYQLETNTLFLAEGLLMYLKPDEVAAIFRFIRGRAGRKSHFAFTFMEPQADGKVNFRNSSKTVDMWLWWRGEIFQWGLKREDLASYLKSMNFSLLEVATPETFRNRYLVNERLEHTTLADGEYICLAERM